MNTTNALRLNPIEDMCNHCQRLDLLDMLNDPLFLLDVKDGKVLFLNQRALSLYRYTKTEVERLSIGDLSHESEETLRDRIQMVVGQGKRGCVLSAVHKKKNGIVFKVEISARFLKLHGLPVLVAMIRDVTEDSRVREEIATAAKVQRRLLPKDQETELFLTRSVYQPLAGLSGDVFDVQYDSAQGVLNGFLVDVMGHGLAASSQLGVLRYLFRQSLELAASINQRLMWINREVAPFFSGSGFAAALLFRLDFERRELAYAAAGINQFLVFSNGVNEQIAPGLFLGINPDESYDLHILPVRAGDGFFFLTDGLSECLPSPLDPDWDFWRMLEWCEKSAGAGTLGDDATALGVLLK
ncbi:MAG TPA: SpoIIE family protein phosphatase [Patescibacteria group bacterium]|nr:SpoIIE family protein phosphatase [Patescibacteria group bacterium]